MYNFIVSLWILNRTVGGYIEAGQRLGIMIIVYIGAPYRLHLRFVKLADFLNRLVGGFIEAGQRLGIMIIVYSWGFGRRAAASECIAFGFFKQDWLEDL